MSDYSIGVVGSDGHTPSYQPDSKFEIWAMDEIYLGSIGKGKFIPKVNDYVVEKHTGNMYRVVSLSDVTYIPELAPIALTKTITTEEILASSPASYRIYYDKSVTPHTLSVDGLLQINGSANAYARIYKGNFIDEANIISRRYNNSGAFISYDIPLELVAFNALDNYAIKSVPSCNTDQTLLNGEVATVAFFDANGKYRSRINCLIEETTFLAPAYNEQKYIAQIYLKSAFISEVLDNHINYPVNLPAQSFNPIGVVQYNDGTALEYPVDGNKFVLLGMSDVISTVIGHSVPLTLKYKLSPSESAIGAITVTDHAITRPYTLRVSSPNTSYNAKLFVYPVWVDSLTGYRLTAYLTNLDRGIMLDVTQHLALTVNSPAFNPMAYGVTQRLIFNLDLSSVSSIFNHFLHVQTVDIILRAPASDAFVQNIWEVASQVPSLGPYYGTSLRATVDAATRMKLSIHNNFTSVDEFLTKVYLPTKALFNPMIETSPLQPTHMEVSHLNESFIVPVSDFKSSIQFTHEIPYLNNITITFLRQTANTYLYLSIAALTVR